MPEAPATAIDVPALRRYCFIEKVQILFVVLDELKNCLAATSAGP